MGLFNPVAPGIRPTTGVSNPNASNPLTPATQIGLAGRPSSSVAEDPTVAQWNAYLAQIQAALQASSGWERTKFEAQLADAQKGRDNAVRIAELQAKTSRYGTDQNTAVQLAQLRQNQQQFDANHGLEVAKAYTAYSQTPDMMFARNDFVNALGRTGQGLSPAPVMSQGTPQAKNWQDFAVLSGYGNATTKAGASGGGAQAKQQSGGGSGGGGTDPRHKAVKAVMDAIPPSDTAGHDDQDYEALNAIRSLYAAGMPGSVERLGASRQKIANAGLARMGYDANLVNEDYKRGLPGQQSVRAA